MSSVSRADDATQLVQQLQSEFVRGLEGVASGVGENQRFVRFEWLRDGGIHGGGNRYSSAGNSVFNRASVNVSHIHYDDMPNKALSSATAISTIIHPCNPHAPSVHMHISWTEMRDGNGYWRLMADLNPAIFYPEDAETFEKSLADTSPTNIKEALEEGKRYFYIPTLDRHRGATHFYLEKYQSGDFEADIALARDIGRQVITTYLTIFQQALENRTAITKEDKNAQLDYHTLYFFQVLTLDRGTTSGLLVHAQNDHGIMGSLPSYVNKNLLLSWLNQIEHPQNELLAALIGRLPDTGEVNDETRGLLAEVVRKHYGKHPEAIKLQASGSVIPPTLKNHS